MGERRRREAKNELVDFAGETEREDMDGVENTERKEEEGEEEKLGRGGVRVGRERVERKERLGGGFGEKAANSGMLSF